MSLKHSDSETDQAATAGLSVETLRHAKCITVSYNWYLSTQYKAVEDKHVYTVWPEDRLYITLLNNEISKLKVHVCVMTWWYEMKFSTPHRM